MKWDDLRYVLAVAREGTISGGARVLGVDPTTVSRRLRSLEQQSGSKLFEKLNHGATLSAAGEEMVRTAESMEELANALDARIHGLDAKLEGPLRVTSVHPFHAHFMTDYRAFIEKYPGIDLELTSSPDVANLTQREADVAVRFARTAPGHLVGGKHAEVYFAAYASCELIAEVGADAPYDSYPWVSWDLSVSRSTDDWLKANAPNAQVSARVNSIALMNKAVEDGIGATILTTMSGDTNPRLRRIGEYFEGGLFIWILMHAGVRGSARIRAFTKFLRSLIQRDLDLIEGRCPYEPS